MHGQKYSALHEFKCEKFFVENTPDPNNLVQQSNYLFSYYEDDQGPILQNFSDPNLQASVIS